MKNIAIIGVGKMGVSHLAIANQTPGLNVAAICDTSTQLLRVIEKNTAFKCFTDYKQMFDEVALDGVMILVPNSFHYEIAKYCINRGAFVFIEKPLTLSYEDSEELINLAVKNNVKGQVGYVNRFNPVFHYTKSLLSANIIGDISSYINRMTGAVILKDNKGWRNEYSKGGGCLYDYGPHCFDLSTYFFGTEIKVVSSILKKVYSTAVDDVVYSTFLHDNKVVGLNYINWSDSTVRKATNSIEIAGHKGKIIATKQELSVYLAEKNIELGLEKGWTQLYITDHNTDVAFYLRGEDFSLQLAEFSKLLNGEIESALSSLYTASIVDKLLEETKTLAGELR